MFDIYPKHFNVHFDSAWFYRFFLFLLELGFIDNNSYFGNEI